MLQKFKNIRLKGSLPILNYKIVNTTFVNNYNKLENSVCTK